MNVDLNLLERWLACWTLSRGVPAPSRAGGGLVVEVGWPDQLRRHVFADAGPAFAQCASRIHAPFIHLKAAVDPCVMRRALPANWSIQSPGFLMGLDGPMAGAATPPEGYTVKPGLEHGASVVSLIDPSGQPAASGRIVIHQGTAVFDRIETLEPHRRKGLGTALMLALDALAEQAGVSERLLVATGEGRALYSRLGWRVLAPYSTAVIPAACAGTA